jgi:hypothetical protein
MPSIGKSMAISTVRIAAIAMIATTAMTIESSQSRKIQRLAEGRRMFAAKPPVEELCRLKLPPKR